MADPSPPDDIVSRVTNAAEFKERAVREKHFDESDAVPPGEAEAKRARERKARPQRDLLIDLCEVCEFWHTPTGEAMATFPITEHYENWALRTPMFKRWLARQA